MISVLSIYQSTIGKKAVMAITGLIGFGFVIGHMIGNLQVFPFLGGAEALNKYAVNLRKLGGILYLARLILLSAVILHIVAAYQLTRVSLKNRNEDYRRWVPRGSDYASRTMRWSGPILLLFIVYHLMHLTFGNVHPNFEHLNVYANVVSGFQVWYVSAFYIIAMIALALHLYHGVWSMFQTLGFNNPVYNRILHRFSVISAIVIALGNISIPVAVMTGYIR
ncbi:MAG TPA: succinate dehydrogenase cytochrome b subunit [Acidobacteriota bacterium]|nr:succinate dehydrogenase cytochrome b subunit [Acidobacteriota bacterium]